MCSVKFFKPVAFGELTRKDALTVSLDWIRCPTREHSVLKHVPACHSKSFALPSCPDRIPVFVCFGVLPRHPCTCVEQYRYNVQVDKGGSSLKWIVGEEMVGFELFQAVMVGLEVLTTAVCWALVECIEKMAGRSRGI